MFRVSTTTLESFRCMMQEVYGNEEELVASIMGKPFEPNWKMNAGSEWHALLADHTNEVLEGTPPCTDTERLAILRETSDQEEPEHNPGTRRVVWASKEAMPAARPAWELREALEQCAEMADLGGKYGFSENAVALGRKLLGPGLWEVKATREFNIDGRRVNVVAKADHVRGLIVTDNKVKFSTADARGYEGSLQWRFYLAVHGAACFRYVLFSFSDPDDGGFCKLRDTMSFKFFPYEALEDDCRYWLGSFMEWAASRRLLPYLEREGTGALPEAA